MHPISLRLLAFGLTLLGYPVRGFGQEPVTLAEEFKPGHTYTVDVRVKLAGKLALPQAKGKPPQLMALTGESHLRYDERILAPDEEKTLKAVRAYREVAFQRVVGANTQNAGIRPSVRRMVIIKSGPRKAPFSPDGPLSWNEIDVVRTDVFNPAAVPGLLPNVPVRAGQTWKATAEAVAELTDMGQVDEGGLTVELVGVTTVDRKRVARLRVSGTVRGVNEDGPSRQKLEGTAYFDLDDGLLTYLSVRGTHDLLDGSGQTAGTVDGRFVMSRTRVPVPPDLSDTSLRGLDLKPGSENTLLLYDNPDLGVRFLHPRGWRVGAVQGKQVTLDHGRANAGILFTLEPATKVPTPEDYLKEVTAFLRKQQAQVGAVRPVERVRGEPVQLDRFAVDATFGTDKVRLEYAVLKQTDGGVTVAARLPAEAADKLLPEVDRVIRSLSVTRRIEMK